MIEKLKVGDRIAAFYQYNQPIPALILTVSKIGKASFWTDNGERWDRSGRRHGRDKWSCAHVEMFTIEDESRWALIRDRRKMECELKRYAEMSGRLPLIHLIAICEAIKKCDVPVVDREDPEGKS